MIQRFFEDTESLWHLTSTMDISHIIKQYVDLEGLATPSNDERDDFCNDTGNRFAAKSLKIHLNYKSTKSRLGGGFTKCLHTAAFAFSRYTTCGIGDQLDHNDKYFFIALETLASYLATNSSFEKGFLTTRTIPNCKLKDVCSSFNARYILGSFRNRVAARTEPPIGDQTKHYFGNALFVEIILC